MRGGLYVVMVFGMYSRGFRVKWESFLIVTFLISEGVRSLRRTF